MSVEAGDLGGLFGDDRFGGFSDFFGTSASTCRASPSCSIMLMPKLLAYLVAAFLLFDGVLFLVIGWQLRRFARLYGRWREEMWSAPER